MNQSGPATGAGVRQLGFAKGMVVEELGWDEDSDEDVRQSIMEVIDSDLVDESTEAVDAVILWLREGDGDVMDLLIDSLTDLGPAGFLWVFTPKIGQSGYVSHSDLSEGVTAAGLTMTTTVKVCPQWSAHKVVRPKATRR